VNENLVINPFNLIFVTKICLLSVSTKTNGLTVRFHRPIGIFHLHSDKNNPKKSPKQMTFSVGGLFDETPRFFL
jgi:hypothetical protein